MCKNINLFQIYSIFGFVLLSIIGIPLVFFSCNLNVKNGCLTKYIDTGNVINTFTTTSHIGDGLYPITVHIIYNYGDNTTCEYQSWNYYHMQYAEEELKKFPIGKESSILINKMDLSQCTYKIHGSYVQWCMGITLISLAGFLILINLIKIAYSKYDNYKYINYDQIIY